MIFVVESASVPEKTARRGMLWAIAADCSNSVFAQLLIGSPTMVLFLNQLGMSKGQIGLVLSFLPFAGILALFVARAVARYGYKRIYLTFWSIRKIVMGTLVFAPLVAARFGLQSVFLYVAVVFGLFAVCRALGETAYYPWTIEFVPSAVRGKFAAVDNIASFITAFMAISAASYFIGRSSGVESFAYVIGVGVCFGFLSVAFATRLPGGKPRPAGDPGPRWQAFRNAMADRNMRLFLAGAALVILISQPLGMFLPLFMREQVGLRPEQVVLLQNGSLLGMITLSYVWGLLADRFGSKVVAVSGIGLRLLLPVVWLLIPRNSGISLPIALGAAFLDGVATSGWDIGASRLLYVNLVPPEHKTEYLAVRYSWLGIVGGISPLVAGQLLDRLQGLSGRFLFFVLDPYTFLFVGGVAVLLAALLVVSRIRVERV